MAYYRQKVRPTVKASLEYLAGFFDGEGCVFVGKRRRQDGGWYYDTVRVEISQRDPQLLTFFADRFGGTVRRKANNGRPWSVCHWRVEGGRAEAVLRALLPYLHGKRQQAELALDFCSSSLPRGISGRDHQAVAYREISAWRTDLAERISALKKEPPEVAA